MLTCFSANLAKDYPIAALSAVGPPHMRFVVNEFSYLRDTEIYGEKEPAE